jgi:type VI secretion system secreted protein VgrG
MPISQEILRLSIEGVTQELRALRLEGHEGVSELFELRVTIATEGALAFADVIQKPASLEIDLDAAAGGVCRWMAGIVARIEHEHVGKRMTQYCVTIVPWAWLLIHRTDTRIFQDLTAPMIIERVFQGAGRVSGTDYRSALQAAYTQREFCVQYNESDWDFVCRLMEEEGIAYFFEHSESGHKLVLVDKPTASSSIDGTSTLLFRPPSGAMDPSRDATHVSRFQLSGEVRSGKVTLRDYDFVKPALLLEGKAEGTESTDLEVYEYPGEFTLPADGAALSNIRLGALAVPKTHGSGDSACPAFSAGFKFTLSEHPRTEFDREYLLTRVEHFVTDGFSATGGDEEILQSSYRNSFEVIPSTVQFRPPLLTRRPRILGAQTAIVVGPSGEEIYVDKYGRVKVQFHWDRLGKKDDKSSCWVRVAQTWAGEAWGSMFIPRINQEVVVTFLDGNPDCPLIVGSVYHGTNVTPYSLPGDKTRSTIKSNSTPGGGGSNELRFEDKKGSEEVYIHAQKDWTIGVENDKNQKVGHDETLNVGHDRTKEVQNDQTSTVDHDDTLTVKNDQTITVQHDQSVTVQNNRSMTVQADHTEAVTGKQTMTVGKAQSLTVSDKQEISISKTRSLKVGDDVTESFGAKLTLSVSGDVSETMSGKRAISLSGDHTESVGGNQKISVTGDSTETVSGKKTFTITGNVTITSGSSTVTIKPSGEISIQGVQMSIDASGPLKIHGATIDVKSDGPSTSKAATIQNSADGPHTIKGAMIVLDGSVIRLG